MVDKKDEKLNAKDDINNESNNIVVEEQKSDTDDQIDNHSKAEHNMDELSIPSDVLDVLKNLSAKEKNIMNSYVIEKDGYEKSLLNDLQKEKNEKLLYAANVDNVEKKLLREIEKAKKYANESLSEQLLGVLDSFNNCITSIKSNASIKSIDDSDDNSDLTQENCNNLSKKNEFTLVFDGVQKIYDELQEVLNKNNIVEVEIIENETKFDSSKHMAISNVETSEHETDTIAKIMRKGYMIHDRCLRPSLVSIYKNISV